MVTTPTEPVDSPLPKKPPDFNAIPLLYAATRWSPSVYATSGAGLAIAKSIVEKMGGTITVASKIGIGTTFTIELVRDCKQVNVLPSANQEVDDVRSVLEGKKVLLWFSIEKPQKQSTPDGKDYLSAAEINIIGLNNIESKAGKWELNYCLYSIQNLGWD